MIHIKVSTKPEQDQKDGVGAQRKIGQIRGGRDEV